MITIIITMMTTKMIRVAMMLLIRQLRMPSSENGLIQIFNFNLLQIMHRVFFQSLLLCTTYPLIKFTGEDQHALLARSRNFTFQISQLIVIVVFVIIRNRFRVRVRNENGASPWSSPSVVMETDASIPKEPIDLQVVSKKMSLFKNLIMHRIFFINAFYISETRYETFIFFSFF